MTPQDIAQVVADAVEREGLDADEVLVAVAAELVDRRRGRGPFSPILSVFAQHPTLAELRVMMNALSFARQRTGMRGVRYDSVAVDEVASFAWRGDERTEAFRRELERRGAIGTTMGHVEAEPPVHDGDAGVRWGVDQVVRDTDGRVIGMLASDPWNGMGPGRPPVCVSCGGPRDRADSDQCVACRG